MTDNLQGDLLTLRYVELDKALAWLWGANPKVHDSDGLLASIKHYGFRDPSIYDGTLPGIAAGNGRLQALEQLRSAGEHTPRGVALDDAGNWHVPIIFGADAVSQAIAEAFGLDHNQLTIVGFKRDDIPRLWRQDDYLALLKRLSDEDAVPVSVAADEVGDWLALLDEAVVSEGTDPGPDIDRAAELRDQWGTEAGQLWEIPSLTVPGRCHRLLCGDSTVADDVQRLLNGQTPRNMITDPPYGVEYDPTWRHDAGINHSQRTGTVANDDQADWRDAWILSPAEVVYCWHAGIHASRVQAGLEAADFEIRAQIIWAKPRFVLSRGHYHWQHEPCWYGVRRGATAQWIGDHSQATVWPIPQNDDVDMKSHGTQKPNECMLRPLLNHTGDVYDPFAGTGTTMVVAEQIGRLCYAMDVDPAYCAVILERLSGMGLEPRLVASEVVGA